MQPLYSIPCAYSIIPMDIENSNESSLKKRREKLSFEELSIYVEQAKAICLDLFQRDLIWENLHAENIIIHNGELQFANQGYWPKQADPYMRSEALLFQATQLVQQLLLHSELASRSFLEIREIVFPEVFHSIEDRPVSVFPSHDSYPSEWLECFIVNSSNELQDLLVEYFEKIISRVTVEQRNTLILPFVKSLSQDVIEVVLLVKIVRFYFARKEWAELEKFVLGCLQMPLKLATFLKFRTEVYSLIKNYAEEIEDYLIDDNCIPIDMEIILQYGKKKGYFFNPLTNTHVPVFGLAFDEDGERDVVFIEKTESFKSFQKALKDPDISECAVVMHQYTHAVAAYILKGPEKVKVYLLDAINFGLEFNFEEYLRAVIEKRTKLHCQFFTCESVLQHDFSSCFGFAIKMLSYFIKYPAIKQKIDRTFALVNSQSQSFEFESPKIMRLMQSSTFLDKLRNSLNRDELIELKYEELKRKHFRKIFSKGKWKVQNNKAWHHSNKYDLMVWKAFFNKLKSSFG